MRLSPVQNSQISSCQGRHGYEQRFKNEAGFLRYTTTQGKILDYPDDNGKSRPFDKYCCWQTESVRLRQCSQRAQLHSEHGWVQATNYTLRNKNITGTQMH